MTKDTKNIPEQAPFKIFNVSYVWDVENDELNWGEEAHEALNMMSSQLPATMKLLNLLVNPQDLPARLAHIHKFRSSGVNKMVDALSYRLRLENGQNANISETMNVLETGKGTYLQGHIKLEREISCRKSNQMTISQSIVSSDNCGGRIALETALQEAMEAPFSQIKSGFFLAVGIDRLSVLNEAMGARYVDEVIEKTQQRLAARFASFAQIARINGDVFGLLFKYGNIGDMALIAQKIIAGFRDVPLITSSGPVRIGVSVGGVAYDNRTQVSADIIARAETALRRAKEQGRGCFVAYEHAANFDGSALDLLRSGEGFLEALKEGRVKLAYQAIIDAKAHKQRTSFHECLVRMVDKNGALINAAQFVPAVETLGMVRMLDQCAMRLAMDELIRFPDVKLSVNVSKWSFCDKDWLRGVVMALRDRPHAARRLVIEITESVAMQDLRQADIFIKTLKELGCRIALDDFGAGQTGFSQIQNLDVDIIKIDKGFVRGLKEHKNQIFIKAMQMLADGVELETVGEGAETNEDAAHLANSGIHHIQGYVYGMPSLERIWLPKNHIQRKSDLSFSTGAKEKQQSFGKEAAAVS